MEKRENSLRTYVNILSYGVLILLSACKGGVEPIDYGKEACSHCKMTIVDHRFSGEMITEKGKVYKFDDVICMKQFADYYADLARGATYFISEYASDNGEFINAITAVYLKSDFFKSPMNGNAAAYVSIDNAKHLQDSLSLQTVNWSNL